VTRRGFIEFVGGCPPVTTTVSTATKPAAMRVTKALRGKARESYSASLLLEF